MRPDVSQRYACQVCWQIRSEVGTCYQSVCPGNLAMVSAGGFYVSGVHSW